MNKDKLIPKIRFPKFENDGEWVEKKLESFIDLFSGIALKSEEISDDESGRPILRGINITEGYIRHSNDIDKYFLGHIENLEKYFVKENDIVIGMDGSKVGKNVALIGKEDEDSILIQRVARIRTNENADIQFVYQYFISDKFRNYVDTVNTSSGIPHVSAQQIKDFKVGIPLTIHEQQKIASCLSSLDELISAQNQKLELLKDHKKGLMQNLFPQEGETVPQYRFPEFENDGEWIETTVENNCEIKGRIGYRGYTTHDIVGQGEGALVLGGKHIQNQLLELKDPTYLSWDKYYESPEIMVEVGHIIFSQRGTLGDCAIIDREIGSATINPSMVLIKNITCDARFLYYILIGDCIQEEVRKNRSKGAIPMLSQKQIKEFSFLIPKPKEQQKIASCLSAVDELITAQGEKIKQLKLHKKGLMQGLFPKINN
jgi:type I restriction enzyme S subunit